MTSFAFLPGHLAVSQGVRVDILCRGPDTAVDAGPYPLSHVLEHGSEVLCLRYSAVSRHLAVGTAAGGVCVYSRSPSGGRRFVLVARVGGRGEVRALDWFGGSDLVVGHAARLVMYDRSCLLLQTEKANGGLVERQQPQQPPAP